MRINHNNNILLRFRYLHSSTFRSRFNDRPFFYYHPRYRGFTLVRVSVQTLNIGAWVPVAAFFALSP